MPVCFSPAAVKFLRQLKRNNDRTWFDARKAVYEEELKAPMLALVGEVNHALADFAPDYVRPPQKAMMRIYRDIRFSKDKRPYKTNLGAWWARHGLEKTSGGGFYLHVSDTEVVIAAGVYMPEREQLLAIRRYLAEHFEEFTKLMASPKLRKKMTEFEGMSLTRPPKGFAADHPAIKLLQQRQWGISAHLPAEAATKPTLLKEIVSRFELATPLVTLLNTPLSKPKKAMF